MNKVELLAPAGDLEKLKMAIDYGADAVYLGGESFGLRTASKNFSLDDIKKGVNYAHSKGAKVHVTMNIVPHNEDLIGLRDYVKGLEMTGIDAVIISDPGMFSVVKETCPNLEIHISTQGSVTNYETAMFWYNQGAKRIVLARELSLEEIRDIVKRVPKDLEIEAFVHGAMCMSYSGRCLISNYMTGRDANRGDCAHSCRFKYHLMEETRPGQYYPVFEDDQGTFIMNSKDLCMIEHIDELIEAGIDSFKMEGRVKSAYYVATITRSYRKAIDNYYEDPENYEYDPKLLDEIRKVSYRAFTTGFYFNKAGAESHLYESSSYIREYDFIGIVLDYDKSTGVAKVEQRNRIFLGDKVEVFGPYIDYFEQTIDYLKDEKGIDLEVAPHPQQILDIKMDRPVAKGYMLRKKKELE